MTDQDDGVRKNRDAIKRTPRPTIAPTASPSNTIPSTTPIEAKCSGRGPISRYTVAIWLTFIIGFGSLGAVLWHASQDTISEKGRWVGHTYRVILTAQRLLSATHGAEAGVERFLLTRQPGSLDEYLERRGAASAELAALIGLTRDNSLQQDRLAAVRDLLASELDAMARAVTAAAANSTGETSALGFAVPDGGTMRQLDDSIAAVVAHEEWLLDQRRASARQAEARILLQQRVGFCAILVLFALAGTGAIRLAAAREKATDRIVQAAVQQIQATEMLRRLVEVSPIGMGCVRRDGAVLYANQSYLRALGATEEELAAGSVSWTAATPPEWRHNDRETIARLDATGRSGPLEKEYAMPDGGRIPVITAAVTLDGGDSDIAMFALNLTEVRQLQAELVQTTGMLTSLFESSTDCFKILDLDGRLLSLNGAARAKLRLQAADEVLGRLWDGIWPASQGPALRAALEAARQGQEGRFTGSTTDDEGNVRWWDVVVTPVPGNDGRPWRLLAISRDVTSLKGFDVALRRSEAALVASEQRLRSIVETAVDGILVASTDGRIVSANPAAVSMFGYGSEDELVGSDLSLLMPLTKADRHAGYMTAHRLGDQPRVVGVPGRDLLARRRDGSEFPISLSVSSVSIGDEEYMTGIIRDITQAKQVEAALYERTVRLDLAMQSASLGVYEVDIGKQIVRYDQRASEISGGVMLPDAWLSMHGPEFRQWLGQTHPEDAAARQRNITAMLDGTINAYEDTFRIRGSDGKYFHMFCSATVLDRDPLTGRAMHLVGILADVTARVEAEATLERLVQERTQALLETTQELQAEMRRREEAQAALLQSQKMEVLGQLTSGVAHDFNNVLGALVASLHFIGKRATDERLRRHVAHGEKAVERAMALVRQLLAFARHEKLERTLVDVGEVLAGVNNLVRHSIGLDVELEIQCEPDLWPVLADQHVLEVALLNLAVNARDAMPQGGRLTIRARNASPEDARPDCLAAGDYLVISVADTGVGMPPEVLEKALTPFFTTKDPGKGTGLGLPMVKNFARELGGALVISSKPNEGTTVDIHLPRAEQGARASEQDGAGAPVQGNAKILLVDDDEGVRMIAAAYLEELGHAVVEAENAESALAALRAEADIDLLITDIVMPGINGLALAAKVRAEYCGVPVVFITGFADDHNLSGEAFLTKPFNLAGISRLVAATLGQPPSSSEG